MCSHLFIFAIVAFAFGVRLKKIISKSYVKELTVYIFFCRFCGVRNNIQIFNPSELVFVDGVRCGPISFFCILLSSYPNTIF